MVAGSLLLAGCGGDGDEAEPGVSVSGGKIGLAMPTTSSSRWVNDAENMAKQFELLGYEPWWSSPRTTCPPRWNRSRR